MEEEDFKKLSIEQLCTHKSWKARILGYNKVFNTLEEVEDKNSSEWTKFSSLFKQFACDNNLACQERGLEIVLMFVENSSLAGKLWGDLLPEVIQKCLASPKARIRELAGKIVAMYVEIEKHSAVLEELVKGMQSKNPRVKVASVQALKQIFTDFGPRAIPADRIIKDVVHLVEDKDQTVRSEARQLLAVICLWDGEHAREKLLKGLKNSHMADIEVEYEKIKGASIVPKRFLRSQKSKSIEDPHKLVVESSDILVNQVHEDDFDSLIPVNILGNINETFFNKINSKKWVERRDALDNLYKLLEESKKLENGDYSELVSTLKKTLLKDSNILVVVSAIKCLTGLSKGLSKNFKQYSNSIITSLFGKFKEKKQNVITALREAVDAVYLSTNLDALQEDILSFLEEKNPSIKAEVASFLTRSFRKSGNALSNKKLLKSLTKPLSNILGDQDPNVRENAAEALGTAMKIVGSKTMSLILKGIEEVHLKKINEYCEKAGVATQTYQIPKEIISSLSENRDQAEKLELPPGIKVVNAQAKVNSKSKSSKTKPLVQQKYEKRSDLDMNEESSKLSPKSTNQPQSFQQQKIDISKVNENILSDLTNKNWKIRLEAVSKLQAIVNSSPRGIKVNLGGFESLIIERIQDNNHQISECAIYLLNSIVRAMGQSSRRYISVYLPVLMKAIGDPKARIRSAVTACLKTWSEVCGVDKFFESPAIVESLKNGSPPAQAEMWNWIALNLAASTRTIPEDCLVVFLQPLYSHLECRHSEVRKRATEAAARLMAHLGYDKMRTSLESVNRTKSSQLSIASVLEKARGNLPVKADTQEDNKSQKKSSTDKETKTENDIQFKKTSLGPFMLHENNSKAQRVLDQERIKLNHKVTKTEQMEELKSIMINEKINASLVSDMFDADYRIHLRAIEKLEKELPKNTVGLKSNLDLILRWIELKTFDQYSCVIQKDLEYLNNIFEILKKEKYNLLDNEATNLLSYIIEKLRDSNEKIRYTAHGILKLIAYIYPPKKQFTHINEGLKSKCAQQRLECIDHLAWLIREFDINISHQSFSQTIKRMVILLEDKDPIVRKAAFNFFIHSCSLDDLNQMDNISDKSMRLLKKYLKQNPSISISGNSKRHLLEVGESCEEKASLIDSCNLKENISENHQNLNEINVEVNSDKANLSELALKLSECDGNFNFHSPKLKEIDLSFLTNLTPIKYIETAKLFHSATQSSIKLTEKGEDLLNQIIETADNGIHLVENLNSEEITSHKQEINYIVDRLTTDFVKLLVELKQICHPGVVCYYNVSFAILKKLVDNSNLCTQISEDNLIRLFEELLLLQKDRKQGDYMDSFARSINTMVFSLLEKSDKSAAICALLKILIVNTSDVSEGFTELVTRCFWKMDKDTHNWDSDLDINKILLLINTFLNTWPKNSLEVAYTKNNLRTVQHLLKKIVSSREIEVLQLVENWSPLTNNTEILQLIKKYSNDLKHLTNKIDGSVTDKNEKLSVVFTEGDHLEENLMEENKQTCSSRKEEGSKKLKWCNTNAKNIKISSETRELWMRLNSLKDELGLLTDDQDESDVRLKEIYAKTNMDPSQFTHNYIEEMKSRFISIQSIINM